MIACQKLSSDIHAAPAPRRIAVRRTIAIAEAITLKDQTALTIAMSVADDFLYIRTSLSERELTQS